MKVSAAILAGGRAARFGHRPKGLAMFGEITVLERQVRALRARCESIALVGDDTAPLTEALAASSLSLEAIADARPSAGPMAGLAAALAWSPTEWTFVVAGDMPLIAADLIEKLSSLIAADVSMIAPVLNGHLHPLAALYNKSAAPAIFDCLERGLLSPRRLFDQEGGGGAARLALADGDAEMLRGFNDQAELDALLRLRDRSE